METPEPISSPVLDPLAPDAPIHHLLSLKHNPALTAHMTGTQLAELVKRIRTLATQAPTLSSALKSESDKTPRKAKVLSTEAQRRKSMLDDI